MINTKTRIGIPKCKNEILVSIFSFLLKIKRIKSKIEVAIKTPGANVIDITGIANNNKVDSIIFLSISKLIPAIEKI